MRDRMDEELDGEDDADFDDDDEEEELPDIGTVPAMLSYLGIRLSLTMYSPVTHYVYTCHAVLTNSSNIYAKC